MGHRQGGGHIGFAATGRTGMYHSQLCWERKRDKAAAVHPPTERSAAKDALARAILGEIQEYDELQHERGHPLERRWVYPWEEEDERPAVYAEQADIWLPGDRAEKAVDKKREDFSGLEEAIERQRSRESYEQEFGYGDFALMAATKEQEQAQQKTQEAGEEEGAKGTPRKTVKLEEVEQPKQEPKDPSRKEEEKEWEIGEGMMVADIEELKKVLAKHR
ncbi:unnamed protein product [Closterium sp. Naga37s-1]|nr:unnamed protein product [Closterium sp. Naga37s-1]